MIDSTAGLFEQFASTAGPIIERHLRDYSDFGAGCPPRLREAIRYSLLAPGKRLRPLLVLSSADVCGSSFETAMPAACAVEMVHTYSLIHDDLPAMDDDDLRRGQPSCHVAFDEATAILAGDALLARAFEILASDLPPQQAARCCAELAHAAGATQMVGGQSDDLAAEFGGGDLRMIEEIHRRKTGAMLTVSLRLGAITSQAAHEQLECLTAYGSRLGLAFQIIDDLLDLSGSTESIGKKTGQDTHRGKLTFPSLMGADGSRRRAAMLVDEAIEQLQVFGARGGKLEALARFVLERNR
jgi:geranylgeranyl diphosphate synthase type II